MRRTWKSLTCLALLSSLGALGAPRVSADAEPRVISIDADDVIVTAHTIVKPGHYRVVDKNGDGVIHVRGKGVRLDLTGVTLDGAPPGAEPRRSPGSGSPSKARRGA